ncbi:MAG: hypothetical protein GC156_01550 [Actinomycetales bacterium]|nr:hypothetical protein [Actinomycetales bacterium]
MLARTRSLWERQDRHPGDRQRLFDAVAQAFPATRVLYPGSYVDVAASFVWPAVTYVDVDSRAQRFFADEEGVREVIGAHVHDTTGRDIRFIHGDYQADLPLEAASFDLLISLFAGFVSEHCTQYLRIGGRLLAHPSHGDVAMAALDPRYRLAAAVTARSGDYDVSTRNLDAYLIPKGAEPVTRERLHASGREITYTRSPFAYVFERVS